VRKSLLRVGAAAALLSAVALVPTAAQGTSPTAPPYPVTSPYIVGGTTKTPIQHLIVVFQENVSYDHYFGTYPDATNPPGEPAFHALPGTPASNNYLSNPSLLTNNPNKDSHGVTINPYRLDRSQAVTCDQDHDYDDEQKAFDGNANGTGAAMDKFVVTNNGNSGWHSLPPETADQGAEVMGYFDGNTVTGMWNLAQHFSMSDNSFGTAYGPSTPGALNLAAGQTSSGANALTTNVVVNNGNGGTCSTSTSSSTSCAASGNYSATNNTVVGDPDPYQDDCSNATRTQVQMPSSAGTGPLNIGDVLSSAGITWGWFQGGFRPTSVSGGGVASCSASHKNLAGNTIKDYNAHHAAFQYFPTTENGHHVSISSPDQIGENDTSGINHEYDESDFYTALQTNHLPAVTPLKGANYQDGHAGTTESDPLEEQTFLADLIDSVEQSPSWSSTAIVVMYDDSDGWYDHVFHPVVNPSSDTQYDFLNGGGGAGSACGTAGQSGALNSGPIGGLQDRCGPGPRLPLMVISPWAKQNYIDHTFTDQSSVIKFIEENWGVGGLGQSAFESLSGLQQDGSQASPNSNSPGDMMSMFDFNAQDQRAPAVILNDQTGEIIPQNQGPQGEQGPQGAQGQQGPAGQNGSNGASGSSGANGSNGTNGAAGPQGPTGDQGPSGNTSHVVCHAAVHLKKITVTCVQTKGARDARARARSGQPRREGVRVRRGSRTSVQPDHPPPDAARVLPAPGQRPRRGR
jgi:phospholipase C